MNSHPRHCATLAAAFARSHARRQWTRRALLARLGVLLNVWATWCLPCREEMLALGRLQAALGGPSFEVVAASIDAGGLPVVQAFFKQVGVKHLHAYLDTFREAAALAIGIPLALLIDRDGREAGRKLGPATWDDPKVVRQI